MNVFIGWDRREEDACRIAEASILKHVTGPVLVQPISMETLGPRLYQRPTSLRDGKLWDEISDAPMSTSHALARFFVPYICNYEGWAVFMDGDVLVRRDIGDLFACADEDYPVQVVKHCYRPDGVLKKGGDIQTAYNRKNWSSVILWNCAHPANRALDLDMLNSERGLHLHGFKWLFDEEIGELPDTWNHLVTEPALVHFTEGLPSITGYERQPYADEWREAREEIVRAL